MPAPPPDLDPVDLARHPLAAAVLGALVGLRFAPGLSWVERAINASSSVALAAIFGPAAAELLRLSPTGESALAGGIALFGLGLAAQIQTAVQGLDLGTWLRAWLPGRPKE
jgi:hypothetical protein